MFIPLCNFTHYSLQLGFSKPKELVKKCVKNNYPACGIADYKTIGGAVAFFKECKSKGIKPIIGCSFNGFSIFARNEDGWKDLISIISNLSKDEEIVLDAPLDKFELDVLKRFCKKGNLIYLGCTEYAYLVPEHLRFFKGEEIKDYYYVDKSDYDVHRISLCSNLKLTLPEIPAAIKSGKNKQLASYVKFFTRNDFNIPDASEATESKTIEEIVALCDDYNILKSPVLPEFPTPNGETEEEYLKHLCRIGWKELIQDSGKIKTPEKKKEYLDRFLEEFQILKEANLYGYFLIVADILHFVNGNGWLSGPGRGSAAGCFISYLIAITKIDPIEFDLLMSRFYNPGRNTKDNISLPDIDIDVPGDKRKAVIAYLMDKYGHENVSQMITYGRLQGRSALKEVLRINKACGFAEMNAMTKPIPDEAAISDQLELMDEEDRGIIKWTLLNDPESLRQFCHIDENGELKGDYAPFFDQAMRLEGTYKNLGKHAAGVVISKYPLNTVCPMLPSKDGERIAGFEMNNLADIGLVKLDVLSVVLFDKLMYIEELARI